MPPKIRRRPAAVVKAKAAARIIGRNARGTAPGGMRRPAAAVGEDPHPSRLEVGAYLLSEDAHYYGQAGAVAGRIKEVTVEDGRTMLSMALTGTNIDALLQWGTQKEGTCRWHLCPAGCTRDLEDDGLVHVTRCRAVNPGDLDHVGWATNLQPVVPRGDLEDENAGLRKKLKELQDKKKEERRSPDRKDKKAKDRGREKSREKKDPKKRSKKSRTRSQSEERRKRKKKKAKRGSSPASVGGSRGGDRKRSRGKPLERTSDSSSSATGQGQVSQKRMFRGTALDLSSRVRKRVYRRAQRFIKRKKSSSTGSNSSEGSNEDTLKTENVPLFGDELKIRGLAERFPGLMASESLRGIGRMVSMDMGDGPHTSKAWHPLLVRYYRQVLSRRISGAMGRELLTHCSIIDSLLEGKVAQALDISLQRIKGLELQAGGTSYQISQRLEVIPSEQGILPSRQELAIIQKERNQEAKAYGGASHTGMGSLSKGKGAGKEDRPTYKGKEPKGKGKAKSEGKKQEENRKTA